MARAPSDHRLLHTIKEMPGRNADSHLIINTEPYGGQALTTLGTFYSRNKYHTS
jgi:hypothetical protein